MNIALVYGGNSSERVISILSGKHIVTHLLAPDRNVFEIDICQTCWRLVAVNGQRYPAVRRGQERIYRTVGRKACCI